MAKEREAIGLDIGTSGVRAAHLGFAKHPSTLQNFGQVALPPGAMRDGEIVDPAVVTAAVSELWRRASFKRKAVTLGVANQKIVARPIDLPFMEEKELRGAIQYQVQEYIPIPIEDAVLDYQVLDEFVTENNERMMRVLLVAAQKDMINSYVSAVANAGLVLTGIDFIPLALIRSLGEKSDSLTRPAGGGEAIIDIGAAVTSIVVHESGIPRFARVLSVGGSTLTEAISGGLGISIEEAEGLKQQIGLGPMRPDGGYQQPQTPQGPAGAPGIGMPVPGSASPGGVPSQGSVPPSGPGQAFPGQPGVPVQGAPGAAVGRQAAQSMNRESAARILEQRASQFLDELKGSIDYYAAQADSTPVTRVVVTGGGSKLLNLAERLSQIVRLPVERVGSLRRLEVTKIRLTADQLAEAEPLMGAAVGVALGAQE